MIETGCGKSPAAGLNHQLMTELEQLEMTIGRKASSCSCDTCKSMCHHAPCIGTPQDILRLINNGHIDKMAGIQWAVGRDVGWPLIPMIQIEQRKGLPCHFLTADGLCGIHDIKPSEGKLACHTGTIIPCNEHPAFAVARTWLQPKNLKTVTLILKAYMDYEKANP